MVKWAGKIVLTVSQFSSCLALNKNTGNFKRQFDASSIILRTNYKWHVWQSVTVHREILFLNYYKLLGVYTCIGLKTDLLAKIMYEHCFS